MATLTIEISEKVEKTFIDLVELLGGKVLKKDLKANTIEDILSVNNVKAIEHVDLPAIVFMKFGYHAKEEKDAIIKRKKNEFKKTGKMFWGYGGNVCHPEKQVRQFVKSMNLQGKKVFLAMSFTKSKATMTNRTSLQYSIDNSNWNNVPDGIEVRGSKYAIVCSELLDCNINLNLNDYEVAVGDKKGKRASGYIKGQNDKGCLIKSEALTSNTNIFNNINKVEISLLAEIIEPYAVFMSQD